MIFLLLFPTLLHAFTPNFPEALTDVPAPSIEVLEQKWGKTVLKENNTHYLERQGLRYPLSYQIKNNKVRSLYFRYLDTDPEYQKRQIEDWLKEKKLIWNKVTSPTPHLFEVIEIPSLKLKLTFRLHSGRLYSVEKKYE